ncbi:hypothetical protein DID73_01045 [Candidatus Marinamargulisbacteria bacterium SCGC AG-343-K17]|nr:hypothetical protein DID73_01045 [Candidatus Marinamargulisbacteria bacterium SCGC AG-343-K17]
MLRTVQRSPSDRLKPMGKVPQQGVDALAERYKSGDAQDPANGESKISDAKSGVATVYPADLKLSIQHSAGESKSNDNKERYFDICREMERLLDNVDSEDTVQRLIDNLDEISNTVQRLIDNFDELSKPDKRTLHDLGSFTLRYRFMNGVLAKVTEKLESEDGITNGRCIFRLLYKVDEMHKKTWFKEILYPPMFTLPDTEVTYLHKLRKVKNIVYTNLDQSERIVADAYARRSCLLSCFGSSQNRRALTQADLDKLNVQKLFQRIKLLQNKELELISKINDIYDGNMESLNLGYRIWHSSKKQEAELKNVRQQLKPYYRELRALVSNKSV